MQHDDVVAGLNDRHMKFGVQGRFIGRVALGVRRLHFQKNRVDHLQVGIRPQCRRTFGCQPFHITAESDVIEHRFFVTGKQLNQAFGKRRAQHVGYEYSGTRAAVKQPAIMQFGNRFAQRRARYPHAFRQFTFGRQSFPGPQDATQDQQFDLPHDRMRKFLGLNF